MGLVSTYICTYHRTEEFISYMKLASARRQIESGKSPHETSFPDEPISCGCEAIHLCSHQGLTKARPTSSGSANAMGSGFSRLSHSNEFVHCVFTALYDVFVPDSKVSLSFQKINISHNISHIRLRGNTKQSSRHILVP